LASQEHRKFHEAFISQKVFMLQVIIPKPVWNASESK